MSLLRLLQDNNTSLAASMARGFLGSLLLRFAQTLLVFVTTLLLTRQLGAVEFGRYSFALAWVLLLGSLARLGLNQVVTRQVATASAAGDLARIQGMLIFGLALNLTASLVVVVLLRLGSEWFSDDPIIIQVLTFAALLIPLQALQAPLAGAHSGLQQVVLAQLPSLLVAPGVFLLLLWWWLAQGASPLDAYQALELLLLAQALALVFAMLLLWRYLPTGTLLGGPRFNSRAWLRGSLALTLVGALYLVNANADILLLGILRDDATAGIYKATSRGAELVVFVLTLVNSPLGPIISRLHGNNDQQRLQRGLTRAAQVSFGLALPLALALALFSEQFLALFGAEFSDGAWALRLLCLGQLINAAAGSTGTLLIMTGLEREAARAAGMAALLNLLLNLLLIPPLGLIGAALATSASLVLNNLLMLVAIQRHLGLDPSIWPTVRSWLMEKGSP